MIKQTSSGRRMNKQTAVYSHNAKERNRLLVPTKLWITLKIIMLGERS
jgi:hypothetical protein